MPRGVKKSAPGCVSHQFSLKPVRDSCYFPQTITCNFCTQEKPKRRSKNSTKAVEKCLNCPIMNLDRNHGTPAFIIHEEKKYIQQNGGRMRIEHDKKLRGYTDEKSELCMPKPRSKYNYCSVCRENYDDYLEHINCSKHKKKISDSKFNMFILDTVDKVNKQARLQDKSVAVSTENEDDLQILGHSRKRVKVDLIQQNETNARSATNPMQSQMCSPMPLGFPNVMDLNYYYQLGAPYASYLQANPCFWNQNLFSMFQFPMAMTQTPVSTVKSPIIIIDGNS